MEKVFRGNRGKIEIMNEKYNFNVVEQTEKCIQWIRYWFTNLSGNAKGVIVGISGGKDSTVAAKLLCEALGRERVFGVMMPRGEQKDIEDSKRVCEILGINHSTVNIGKLYEDVISTIENSCVKLSSHTLTNISPRLRMTTLYTIGQEMSYRVVGTGNLSESLVGYCTKYGDTASDFAILSTFTKSEVVKIGEYLGLPEELVHKIPSDGLSGVSDEENLGFSYDVLDNFIRTGQCSDEIIKNKILLRVHLNTHKAQITKIFYDSKLQICMK